MRHNQLFLFDDLEVTDYIDRCLGSYQRQLVQFVVLEEFVGNLYDALLAEIAAVEVDTDCYLIGYSLEVEDVQCLVNILSRDMVKHGAVLQCADYQFFSCHDVLF